MGIWQTWGFSGRSWRGERGEYWVVGPGILVAAFGLAPRWWPAGVPMVPEPGGLILRGVALALAIPALIFLGKGLVDLGPSLTPLPYPRQDGQLVQTGVYGWVRHSLYSGLIFATVAYGLWAMSLAHLGVSGLLFALLNAKASQEEQWLLERYPEYGAYRDRVKKFIPWIY